MKVYAKEAQGIQNSIKLIMLLHPGVSISNDLTSPRAHTESDRALEKAKG